MKRILQLLTITSAAVAICAAQDVRFYRDHGDTWVEQIHGSLAAAHTLRLTTELGSVQVAGNAGYQNIEYTVRVHVIADSEEEARRAAESIRVSAATQGDTAWIKGQAPRRTHDIGADFSLTVPRAIELVSAHTGGGSLTVHSVNGKVEAETGGGGLQLDDIGGDVEAQSGGGNVSVGNVASNIRIETGGGRIRIGSAGGAIDAQSGGGNIEIGSGKQNMDLQTGGGTIHVSNCAGELRAETGGGKITVGDVGAGAELSTGGGGVYLSSANGIVRAQSGGGGMELYKLTHGADVETGGGSIIAEFVGTGANFSTSRLETGAGDIRVYLPANLPVTVNAAIDIADGHSINTDFSELKVTSEGQEYGPREAYCQGKLNGGGPTLHIHTTTGNIDLLRSTPPKP